MAGLLQGSLVVSPTTPSTALQAAEASVLVMMLDGSAKAHVFRTCGQPGAQTGTAVARGPAALRWQTTPNAGMVGSSRGLRARRPSLVEIAVAKISVAVGFH